MASLKAGNARPNTSPNITTGIDATAVESNTERVPRSLVGHLDTTLFASQIRKILALVLDELAVQSRTTALVVDPAQILGSVYPCEDR